MKDNEGNPLVGMPVAFTVNTTFGPLRIGAPYTNKQGMASVNYSARSLGTLEFAASFPGGAGYEANKFTVARHFLYGGPEPLPSPLTFSGVSVIMIFIVVISIWTTFAFVLSQIRGIRREGKRQQKA